MSERKIVEYIVVNARLYDLGDAVNSRIKEGFVPWGAPSFMIGPQSAKWQEIDFATQAMVRYEDE